MRLLLVEDAADLARAMADGLRAHGFAVDLAASIAEADDKVALVEYDLVLLDLNLPDGDGVEFCRGLRGCGYPAPVLMLTARDRVSDRVRGLDAGADDYLTKPFAFEELLARIRALLRRSTAERRPAIQVGRLTVCPATVTAAYDGVELQLTSREFAVLEYLARRSPDVVSAEELLEHVCDEYANPFSNTIRVHLANLRRKLMAASGVQLIDTVIGRGYRLWPEGQL
jgi:DNA-binding response OmpR family regulator